MTSPSKRLRVLRGLEERIEYCVEHGRSEEEIAKLAELIVATAEQYMKEDAREAFFAALLEGATSTSPR